MSLRVLHTEWSDAWGGQEMRVLQELKLLRGYGMEAFLATRPGTTLWRRAQDADVTLLPVHFRRQVDLKVFCQIFRAVKQHRIDIVNTHSGKDTWMAGLAARLAGAVFVRTQHFIKPRRWYRSQWIYRLADHVITTGEAVRQDTIQYCRVLPERVTSIPSGPNIHHFDPQRFDRARIRERMGFSKSSMAVGVLSRISQQKGSYLLLRAIEPLLKQHDMLCLYVMGDGDDAPDVRAYAQKLGLSGRVHFTGFLEEPAECLAALDIFVLPSLKEGMPQSLLQALLMGLPAVATRVGSVGELGEDAILLVEPGDEVALRNAIDRMIGDPVMRRRMASHARTAVQGRYSEEIMLDKTVALYQRLVA